MDSLAHEIFLLMLNLSKVSSEARVRSLFLESMNAAIPGIRFRDLEYDAGPGARTFDVRTAGMSFGRIGVDGDLDGLPDVARALIRNAIGMLAVMLERCRHL
ncbi:MAG: hypothetical protein HY822_07050, partial [Acidobacteria bacterium]|nr:hypothetical protein [Acidobacteriota bacterium]